MKSIGIIANVNKPDCLRYTAEIVSWLNGKGIEPFISGEAAENAGRIQIAESDDEVCKNSDIVIVFGGDGTILQAAGSAALYNVPLIGINLGTLGYLTDVEKGEGIKALESVINGSYKAERRMMLEAQVEGYTLDNFIALNDICVLRNARCGMLNLDMLVNGEYIDTYKADGIIAATPTGSTAYNLSAGGPILKPDIELIAITPICPHKIYSRSSVVSAEDVVSIKIRKGCEKSAFLSLDGQRFLSLYEGQTVIIKRSVYYTTIIKTNNLGFYDILRRKLHD